MRWLPHSATHLATAQLLRPFALATHTKPTHQAQDARLAEALAAEGQAHLFERWPAPGQRDDDKARLLAQLRHLDSSYAGGLVQYVRNARRLLTESKEGACDTRRRRCAAAAAGVPPPLGCRRLLCHEAARTTGSIPPSPAPLPNRRPCQA